MKLKRNIYGLMGLLSLLGFIGVFTDERMFLAFFAFAVHFQYFFIKSDEMLDEYMNKSAARAFYFGMAAVPITVLGTYIMGSSLSESLLLGLAAGWVISIIVHAVLTSYYEFRESFGVNDD